MVYVDGFNWYYAIFRHRPAWKWLNVQSFFEALRPDEDVVAVKFFTALVDPHKRQSEARDRLKRYLNALQTLKKVRVFEGKFQLREVKCGAQCQLMYKTPEEKKTDVNIAVQMLGDAVQNTTDSIVLVSGDSDLEPAVEWIRRHYSGIKITIYIPALPEEQKQRRNDFYQTIDAGCKFLPLDTLAGHQLPSRLLLPTGASVERPVSWR